MYILLGNIFMEENDYGQALINYGLGVRYGNLEGHKGQGGLAYRLIGQYEDAIDSMTKYIDSKSDTVDTGVLVALMETGLNYQSLVEHEEAINTFMKVLEIDANNNDAKYYMALSYEYIEVYDKAIELLEEVISDDSNYKAAKDELEFIKTHLVK